MRAVIVGGGIAGPATAMALQRVGVESIVLEAHATAREEVGSYFTVSPNGLSALEAIGCLELVTGHGFGTRRNILVGATGRRLGSTGLGQELRPGLTALTMKRPRMAALLSAEAERRGIETRFHSRVTEVTTGSSGVGVTLADGSTVAGDLVLGADGVHSTVRRAIDPAAPSGRYVGLTNFGGVTRRTGLSTELPAEAWTMVFGRRAFFGAHPTPDGDVVWFVNAPRPEISRAERGSTTAPAWLDWLVGLSTDDQGPFTELLANGELELAGDNTYDLGHVPHWHRDRLLILGDAAHAPAPSSGQGASMALEDAVALANAFQGVNAFQGATARQGSAAITEAFAAYAAARRPRVERIVAVGARSSSSKTAGPVARVFQDAVMRFLFRRVITDRSQSWMFDHRVALG